MVSFPNLDNQDLAKHIPKHVPTTTILTTIKLVHILRINSQFAFNAHTQRPVTPNQRTHESPHIRHTLHVPINA